MLDRKTKDYEASEELLEDRIKQTKIFSGMYYILYIVFLLILAGISINIINLDFTTAKTTSLWRLLFVIVTGGFLFLTFAVYSVIQSKNYDDDTRYYKLLLFLKKQNNGKRK